MDSTVPTRLREKAGAGSSHLVEHPLVVISEPFLRLVWVFGLDRLLQRRIARCRKQV